MGALQGSGSKYHDDQQRLHHDHAKRAEERTEKTPRTAHAILYSVRSYGILDVESPCSTAEMPRTRGRFLVLSKNVKQPGCRASALIP